MVFRKPPTGLDVQRLWEKYEDIAMHFNDLLIQLRMRSLAGIAAATTFIGVFADNAIADAFFGWVIVAAFFAAMILVWGAIFCLDYYYYNKLLFGAVSAILDLEEELKNGKSIKNITLSTSIESQFSRNAKSDATFGVFAFYIVVLILLVLRVGISLKMAWENKPEPAPISTPASPVAIDDPIASLYSVSERASAHPHTHLVGIGRDSARR